MLSPDDDSMQDVIALLQKLDHPVPPVTAKSVMIRAGAAASTRRRVPPLARWAAAIVMAAGAAGVAYALPGSPVPRWVAALASRLEARPEARPPEAAGPAARARESAGIAVDPGRDLVIVFSASTPGALARVTLGDGAEVLVRSPVGAVTFTSDAGRLLIRGPGAPDTVTIEIPRGARRVEIRAGGARVFLKEGVSIDTRAARLGDGDYEIPLARPPSQDPR
ncbi:MAG: hypothetical protein ACREOQ_03275 [Gemmatimonadales bacterium]